MKKFLVCVFILFCFSGFLFYLGWTQLKIKNDSYGIVVSKTNGIDKELIKSGKITWKKEFLIPTNAEIKEFKIEPVTVETTITGQLPSGDLYTSIYSSTNNFSYSFTYSISLTVEPEELINLYELNRITDNVSLQNYLETAAKTIGQLCTNYILTKAQENPSFKPESIRRDDLIKSIRFYTDYPDIELFAFAITDSKLPDFKLYAQLQNQFILNQDRYFSAEQKQNNIITEKDLINNDEKYMERDENSDL